MTRVVAADLKPGDVITPPERELRLWMRRSLAENDLPESAAHITVTAVYEGKPDTRGTWLVVRGTAAFAGPWAIRMRPTTPWPVVARAA